MAGVRPERLRTFHELNALPPFSIGYADPHGEACILAFANLADWLAALGIRPQIEVAAAIVRPHSVTALTAALLTLSPDTVARKRLILVVHQVDLRSLSEVVVSGRLADLIMIPKEPAAALLVAHITGGNNRRSTPDAIRALYGRWSTLADTVIEVAIGSRFAHHGVNAVAEVIGMDRWTLRRHLMRDHIRSPEHLIAAARTTVAAFMSWRTQLGKHQVARQLSFADPRSLARMLESSVGLSFAHLRALNRPPFSQEPIEQVLAKLDSYVRT